MFFEKWRRPVRLSCQPNKHQFLLIDGLLFLSIAGACLWPSKNIPDIL